MRVDVIPAMRSLMSAAIPTVRLVAMVYTGLGGVAALVLVVSVAAMPNAPVLQQVAEPARQAVQPDPAHWRSRDKLHWRAWRCDRSPAARTAACPLRGDDDTRRDHR